MVELASIIAIAMIALALQMVSSRRNAELLRENELLNDRVANLTQQLTISSQNNKMLTDKIEAEKSVKKVAKKK